MFSMNSHKIKRSYHPFIHIAFHLNFLSDVLQTQLPCSTHSDWKNRDRAAQFGYEFFQNNKLLFQTLETVANSNKLQTTVRVLTKLIALKRFIIFHKGCIKTKVGNSSIVIVNAIEKLKPFLSISKCFYILQVEYKECLSWRRIKTCHHSFFNFCIVQHPYQLLKSEAENLKVYFTDERLCPFSLLEQ